MPRGATFSALLLLSVVAVGAARLRGSRPSESPSDPRSNVLFVCVDDLNDWIGPLGGLGGVAKTPNLDRLAASGTTFLNAHCASPACNPSRVAVLTGLRPTTSGVYENDSDWRAALPGVITLPQLFKDNDYEVVGFGKTFHAEDQDARAWDRYVAPPNQLKYVKHHRAGKIAWAAVEESEELMPDRQIADLAAVFLREERERPFFLSVGLKRPHLPWIVPQSYYDLYDPEEVPLPEVIADDLSDVPEAGLAMVGATGRDHDKILQHQAWTAAVHAYLASISFADAQLGHILDALERGPHADDTIVCLWSDHGFHLGEKGHWRKFTLWEESTRVPLLIRAPQISVPAGRTHRPVDLVHVYPTLVDLCGLRVPQDMRLDGQSLRPLLLDAEATWPHAALTTYRRGNHAVRTERWRYIRYADGSEELYDHEVDPNEWRNLARFSRFDGEKADLSGWLPVREAEPAALIPRKKRDARAADDEDD